MGFFSRILAEATAAKATAAEKSAAEPTLPMPQRAPQRPPMAVPPPLSALPSFVRQLAERAKPPAAGKAADSGTPPRKAPASANARPSSPQLAGSRSWQRALAVPAFAATAATLFVGGMLVYYTATLPNPLTLRHKERAPVIRILAADGSVLAERGAAHDYMPVDLLPRHVTDAVVATEDRRFWDHWGLDPQGLARATFANLRAGRFAQGGSTLTQQLAKNLFLTPERTLGRKVEELLLALWLEVRLSKRDILELYLNQVYFGGGAYGIESAAHRYFDKSARELTIAEAALIAGLLKAPSKYSPASSPGAARARGRSVLKKMVDAGVIGPDDERKALRQRIQFASARSPKDQTGVEHAIDFVLERMPPLIAADHGEIVVETTIDPGLQRRAQEIVQRHLTTTGDGMSASQASVMVLDTDGGIRALIGGRSYADSQFNRAVKARRQPGSAFKPFVYLAALENGYTPDTVAYDLPLSVEGWTPRNDSGQYIGAVSLRQALAKSINTVAVRLLLDVGAAKVAAVASRLGVKSELRPGPTMALGSSEMTLLELTGAFGVLGNGGAAIEPHAIRRVRLSSGRVLFARDATRTRQVVTPHHVGAINDMLNAALVTGTGKRAAIPLHPAAGKTGTTSDFRDAWFIGYTAHLTGGVWVGNDNGRTMNKVMGGNLPAAIWHDIMKTAHEGRAPLALPGTNRSLSPQSVPAVASTEPGPRAPRQRELLPWTKSGVAGSPAQQATLPATKQGAPTPIVAQSAAQALAPVDPAKAAPKRVSGPATLLPPAEPQPPHKDSALPWQSSAKAPDQRDAAGAHPTEQIGADFIARALAGQDPAVAGPTRSASGFDADDIKARLEGKILVRPPEGMMSLGSGQPTR